MKRLLLIFITSVLWQTIFAQTPTLQQKLYSTCKVWGFVKYYHSNVSTCHVNWDSVLLHTLPLVRSATTSNQFNDALDTMLLAAGPMALSTTYFPDTLSPALKRNRNWNWIDSTSFRTDVQTILDTIRNNFRPHAECWVENNSGTTSNNGWLIFPYDNLELNINTTTAYPDEYHRQLMFFKYWNIVRYFYPYNYVLDVPWDSTLFNYVIPIDTVGNSQSLYLTYMKIATALNDTHVFDLTYSSPYQVLPGHYKPFIRLKYIDSQYVVVNSLVSGIYPGDAFISIDGVTTTQWEDSLIQYYSASNMATFRESVCEHMLGREFNGTNESVILEDSSGTYHTVTLTCVSPNLNLPLFQDYIYPADSLDSISWTTMPCDIGYVNMGNLQDSSVHEMYNDLQNKSAIIFDLRNYPNNTAWDIANLIYASPIEYGKVIVPDVTYPGTYYWISDSLGIVGNSTPYMGKVIILMNEITLSQAEYSCMILSAMPGAVKIGSQTAGADGNITYWNLSQDLYAGFTNLGVFYPNGDSTQRIGIVPDSVVYPTKTGIRRGDDEVLDKALAIAGCNLHVKTTISSPVTLQVFPNPATVSLIISASRVITNIAITNLLGQVLYTHEYNSQQVQVSVAGLPKGMYLIRINGSEVRKFVKQ